MLKWLKSIEILEAKDIKRIKRGMIFRNALIVTLLLIITVGIGLSYHYDYTHPDLEDVFAYFIDWRMLEARIDQVLDENTYDEDYDWAPYSGIKKLPLSHRFHLYATQLVLNDLNQQLEGMLKDYNYFETYDAIEVYETRTQNQVLFDTQSSEGVFYLGVYTFDESFQAEIVANKEAINASDRLIIDLRGNPGGYVSYAIDLIDLFLGPEILITTDTQYGPQGQMLVFEEKTRTKASLTPKEIIVLVDEWTASSAEMVTFALNAQLDHVTVLGEQTFGKSVTTLTFDNYYGTSLTLLSGYYQMIDANGQAHTYQEEGIIPEIFYDWQENAYDLTLEELNSIIRTYID